MQQAHATERAERKILTLGRRASGHVHMDRGVRKEFVAEAFNPEQRPPTHKQVHTRAHTTVYS